MAHKEYIRLTPSRQRRGIAVVTTSRSCLWLGPDHLLLVSTDSFTESYKRFYLRDIQAITVRQTNRRMIIAVATGSFTAVFLLVAILVSQIELRWLFGILAAVCAIPFLMNLLYGQTCACHLRTAVQTEDLPSLSRVRRARKFLNRIRPLIAEAQGQMTEDEIAARMQMLGQAPRPATAAAPAPFSSASDDPNAPPRILS